MDLPHPHRILVFFTFQTLNNTSHPNTRHTRCRISHISNSYLSLNLWMSYSISIWRCWLYLVSTVLPKFSFVSVVLCRLWCDPQFFSSSRFHWSPFLRSRQPDPSPWFLFLFSKPFDINNRLTLRCWVNQSAMWTKLGPGMIRLLECSGGCFPFPTRSGTHRSIQDLILLWTYYVPWYQADSIIQVSNCWRIWRYSWCDKTDMISVAFPSGWPFRGAAPRGAGTASPTAACPYHTIHRHLFHRINTADRVDIKSILLDIMLYSSLYKM